MPDTIRMEEHGISRSPISCADLFYGTAAEHDQKARRNGSEILLLGEYYRGEFHIIGRNRYVTGPSVRSADSVDC